ncbi:MAG: hypothetical protein IPJ47_06470 [Anaerolineales bacterium]|nr:hypothetical protein [Anaerolineales bacterium]
MTYANRVLLFGDKHIVADGKPQDVLKDTDMLQKYRVRPTSLLHLNLDLFPKRDGSYPPRHWRLIPNKFPCNADAVQGLFIQGQLSLYFNCKKERSHER